MIGKSRHASFQPLEVLESRLHPVFCSAFGIRHSAFKKLHPVQQKMVEHHGSQCGYCTPGFICSLFEGFYRDDLKTGDDLDEQLAGNLCRCTGYQGIVDAVLDAARLMKAKSA